MEDVEKQFYFFAVSFIGYFALKFTDLEIAGTVSSFLFFYWLCVGLTPSESKHAFFSPFSERITTTQRRRNVAIILGVIGAMVGFCYIDRYLPSLLFSHPKRYYQFGELIKGIYRYPLGMIVIWTLVMALLRIMWVYCVHHHHAITLDNKTCR